MILVKKLMLFAVCNTLWKLSSFNPRLYRSLCQPPRFRQHYVRIFIRHKTYIYELQLQLLLLQRQRDKPRQQVRALP